MTERQKIKLVKEIIEEENKKNNLNIECFVCTRFKYFVSNLTKGNIKLERKRCLDKAGNFSWQKVLMEYKDKYNELNKISGSFGEEKIFIYVDGLLRKMKNFSNNNMFETAYHEFEHAKQERILENKEYDNPNYLRYLTEMAIADSSDDIYRKLYYNLFIEIEAKMIGSARAYNYLNERNLLIKDDLIVINDDFDYANHLLKHYDFMKVFREYLLLCQIGKISFSFKENPLREFVDSSLNLKKFDELNFDKIKILKQYYNDDILDILTSEEMLNSIRNDSLNKKLMLEFIEEKKMLEKEKSEKDQKEYYNKYPIRARLREDKDLNEAKLNYSLYLTNMKHRLSDQIEREQGELNSGRNSFSR